VIVFLFGVGGLGLAFLIALFVVGGAPRVYASWGQRRIPPQERKTVVAICVMWMLVVLVTSVAIVHI
jgi:hypothetical protein